MGKAHSGKTSMRSIIFANYLARDTTRLSPTLDVEHHHVRFLGDLVLNLWDCGGQDAFYESYFERDRETIFRSVELLIYVFDIESESPEKDFDHFGGVLEAIEENSPDARIFVLVHKMDLVAEEDREAILEDRKRLIEDSCISCGVQNFQCFGTSIWDETLYKAWSEIVTNLIPNIKVLESHLNNFCRICDADEVVLFERATFLVISHAQATDNTPQPLSAGKNNKKNSLQLPANTEATGGQLSETEDIPVVDPSSSSVASSPNNADDAPVLMESSKGGEILNGTANNGGVNNTSGTAGGGGGGEATTAQSGAATAAATTNNNTDISTMTGSAGGAISHDEVLPRHIGRTSHFDAHRYEKISNIVKQFKLSCGKAQSQFQGMEVRNSRFSAFLDAFTANTYIMVIVSNANVHTAATLLNIQNARNHFERFIPRI